MLPGELRPEPQRRRNTSSQPPFPERERRALAAWINQGPWARSLMRKQLLDLLFRRSELWLALLRPAIKGSAGFAALQAAIAIGGVSALTKRYLALGKVLTKPARITLRPVAVECGPVGIR